MMNNYLKIDNLGLFISVAVMFIVMFLASINRLKLTKDIFIGTIRAFIQLFIMGFILRYTFTHSHWIFTAILFLFMLLFAAYEAYKRLKFKSSRLFQYILISLSAGSLIPLFIIFYLILKIKPWYNIRYIIPISGMIVANSMTALSLGLNNYMTDIKNNRMMIYSKLSLGATAPYSVIDIFQKAYYNGILPSINSLMVLGIAKLPGMMTGQILAGVMPIESVKYQLMIMYMITFSNSISLLLLLKLANKVIFNAQEQLLI